MQFAFIPLMALAASFVSGVAIPASSSVDSISARDAQSDALASLQALNVSAAAPLDNIKTTLASLTADSSADEKSAATTSIKADVADLVSQINAVTATLPTGGLLGGILKRQDDSAAIAALVGGLIAAVSGIADSLVLTLGLTPALAILNPLVGSLNGLLIALKNLLDQVLILVKNLVDGLLTGLSVGLAGLIL